MLGVGDANGWMDYEITEACDEAMLYWGAREDQIAQQIKKCFADIRDSLLKHGYPEAIVKP